MYNHKNAFSFLNIIQNNACIWTLPLKCNKDIHPINLVKFNSCKYLHWVTLAWESFAKSAEKNNKIMEM